MQFVKITVEIERLDFERVEVVVEQRVPGDYKLPDLESLAVKAAHKANSAYHAK